MDDIFLKMIANPYLLKKNNEKNIIINNNDILYNYVKTNYPKTYLPPAIYNDISKEIDNVINKYIAKRLVDEIIRNSLNKFDNLV